MEGSRCLSDEVKVLLIFDCALARAYRIGVAEAFNVAVEEFSKSMCDGDKAGMESSAKTVKAIFSELERAEERHLECLRELVDNIESACDGGKPW